ncbi:toprim domain-containing protein [Candidatus Poribacteria bacterium]|nr:toprim domain-containing protein [Candidatus Poribacteria bacterium]
MKDKTDFALAFPNASGGYEVRNPDFKGGIGTKDISLLVKRKNTGLEEGVTVFEGFIDFWSALTFDRVTEAKTPVIVLNSVSLKDRPLKKITEMGFEKVYLYLDRDEEGERGVQDFSAALPRGIAPVDKSDLYAGYQDFNEFLVQNRATPSDPMRGET